MPIFKSHWYSILPSDFSCGGRGRNRKKQEVIKVKAKRRGERPGFTVVGGADHGTGIYIQKYEIILKYTSNNILYSTVHKYSIWLFKSNSINYKR